MTERKIRVRFQGCCNLRFRIMPQGTLNFEQTVDAMQMGSWRLKGTPEGLLLRCYRASHRACACCIHSMCVQTLREQSKAPLLDSLLKHKR